MTAPRSRRRILSLVPLAILVQTMEKAVFLPSTLEMARSGLPRWFRLLIPPVPAEQQILAALLIGGFAVTVFFLGGAERKNSWGVRALLWITGLMLVDLCALVVAAGVLGGYVAGLGTAALLFLPAGLLIAIHSWKEEWLGRTELLLLLPAGLLSRGPLFFGVLFLAGYLLRLLHGS